MTAQGTSALDPQGSTRGIGGQRLWAALVVVLASVASLALRAAMPVAVQPDYRFDDQLFVRQARHLLDTGWLGPFDQLTLAKGPAYPMLIAASAWMDVQLKVLEQVTALAAAGAVAVAVLVTVRHLWAAVAVYVLLAFDPAVLSAIRVVREGWFASLTLLVITLLFLSLVAAMRRARVWVVVAVSALAGVSAAVVWMCREETVALLPALVVPLLLVPLVLRREPPASRAGLARRVTVPLALAVVALAAWVPVHAVADRNGWGYGAALTNDMAEGSFGSAYAAWASVQAGPRERDVPISAAQRRAVYAVSPAAAELEPELESPTNGFREMSCRGGTCGDFSGAILVWALRQAATDAHHFGSGSDAQAYFGRIDADVRTACADGRLVCRLPLAPALQPLIDLTPSRWWASVAAGTSDLVGTSLTLPSRWQLSDGVTDAQVQEFARTVGAGPATVAQARAEAAAYEPGPAVTSLATGYAVLLPVSLVAGLVGAVLAVVRRRSAGRPRRTGRSLALVLALSLAVGAAARLALLAVVDATSFDTFGTYQHYQTVTHVLLLAAGLVASCVLVDVLVHWRTPSALDG